MPLRLRRRVQVLPGIKLNFSKSGISTTIGPRGASVNIGRRGLYANLGIPGTGLSYRRKLKQKSAPAKGRSTTNATVANRAHPSMPALQQQVATLDLKQANERMRTIALRAQIMLALPNVEKEPEPGAGKGLVLTLSLLAIGGLLFILT
ncbi:DUF4236 domain-containing protein [Poseidonocella sedimentorum]|uniref:DUF4236 domain-containing protein n=1 Tax=Poseidonocella sedimentorum TaxID=871652 RepID=A0A1I6CW88_9RHOB|nr:DUF4236 domain-containing protein [Poseidonocella sedimentorum]SFQ97363.1 Protein of unknown function [Poseidonocella sedimentorum]